MSWSWLADVRALWKKELRIELRSRHGLQAVLLFALAALVLGSLALGPTRTSPEERMLFGPVLFWLIALFSAALGLPRHFVREEELGTADLLRLALPPQAVYGGKWCAAVTEVWLLELLMLPLLLLFLDLELQGKLLAWSVALFLGGIGLASGSTLLSSMAAQARSPAALFAALALPVFLPLLMLLVGLAHTEEPFAWTLQLLLYDVLIMAAGFLLFPAVWRR